MRLIDFSFADPASNLAYDEVLLNRAESGGGGEALRFWESPVVFVVLGVAQVFAEEVHGEACLRDGVPVMRRCSAGGCVLQGPGCLNYTLILDQEKRPEIGTIRGSYAYLLERLAGGLAGLGIEAAYAGISDLAMGAVKISGNAQRRRKRYILHHGTFLHSPNVRGMTRYLREPADRPAYRGERRHGEFVGRVPAEAEGLKAMAREVFSTPGPPEGITAEEEGLVGDLVVTKYGDPQWIRRR